MLRSHLCDFSDAYIVVKETIVITNPHNDAYKKELAFKNNAPFVSSISKINKTLIDNAEYLDFVMPMYNLLEYSKNYSRTTGSFSNYYRDEPNSGAGGENSNVNYSINSLKPLITKQVLQENTTKEVEIAVLLKHLSNF